MGTRSIQFAGLFSLVLLGLTAGLEPVLARAAETAWARGQMDDTRLDGAAGVACGAPESCEGEEEPSDWVPGADLGEMMDGPGRHHRALQLVCIAWATGPGEWAPVSSSPRRVPIQRHTVHRANDSGLAAHRPCGPPRQ